MKNLIFVTAMHGRLDTVEYCYNATPKVRRIVAYTNKEDYDFIKDKAELSVYAKNSPLSYKWNAVIKSARALDFEGLVVLGSDDFVCKNFINFVSQKIKEYDFIGFKDIYFKEEENFYYWKGYENQRRGEPIGAGRVYSRALLEKLDFNLYDIPLEKSLDGLAWGKIKDLNIKKLITTLKENGLYLADVKDGKGLTAIDTINDLIEIK